ncbi:hypothetical protein KXD93_26715 [Mucilaginibacter sp. BJC16-A38]|uniref:hypothetical protein n=1 Tax=Mucilaginibacter phenanthrenivorans TaxID=1234842 RepID=UPI002158155F|nr:hypothetical protein [Mucilaginibacter phenanthrenivorans]MCR8561274.1 hypothetical protein [Mucilaginibacter phenanthrenivorans]
MKSDLDELIELLETEAKVIKACIKENIEEWDYQIAHHNSRALFKLNQKLNVLHKMKDPLYEEKRNLERMIMIHEKHIKLDANTGIVDYYLELLEEDKRKLQGLKDQKSVPIYDDQKIDDALFSVWAGIYKGFTLYLNKEGNLAITFESVEEEVIDISVTVKSVFNVDYFFGDDDEEDNPLNLFKGLGFMLNDVGNRLVYKYDMGDFKDAGEIKILLSRLVYDVFTYAELDKPTRLMYF